jgi:hypothetical protein
VYRVAAMDRLAARWARFLQKIRFFSGSHTAQILSQGM